MATIRHDKYLTFLLANEGYGIDIQKVKEINEMMPITPIPESPEYMKGIVNLRGKIIPIIDLRKRFGFPRAGDGEKGCIIVVEIQSGNSKHSTGLIVDGVSEVCEIKAEQIEENVVLGSRVRSDYIRGIAKLGDQVKILLNIDKVLTSEEVASIQESAKQA
jgi:purine-binding chemotaxis protein CheW